MREQVIEEIVKDYDSKIEELRKQQIKLTSEKQDKIANIVLGSLIEEHYYKVKGPFCATYYFQYHKDLINCEYNKYNGGKSLTIKSCFTTVTTRICSRITYSDNQVVTLLDEPLDEIFEEITKEDFDEIVKEYTSKSKDGLIDKEKSYKVYQLYPCDCAYAGYSLVAAKSVEDANRIIQDFKDSDKGNDRDSYAYGDVSESDLMEDLISSREGIILEGFYYTGN